MESFNRVIDIIVRIIGGFGIGFGISRMLSGDYKVASWVLLIVSILVMIGYFVERFNK